MAEVILAPRDSLNAHFKGGDARYVDGGAIEWDEVEQVVGRGTGKTPVNQAAGQIFDPSGVPLGSTINDVQIKLRPSVTNSDAFNLTLSVMALDARLNQSDHLTGITHRDIRYAYIPDTGIFPIVNAWDNGQTASHDRLVEHILNLEHGLGSIFQVWTANAGSGGSSVLADYWRLGRSGSLPSTTFETKIYNAAGVAGGYTRGTLISAGGTRAANDIATSVSDIGTLRSGPSVPLTPGNVYVSELEFVGGVPGGANWINIGLDITVGSGLVENATMLGSTEDGNRLLQGFGGYINWLNGARIRAAAASGSPDTQPAPAFTAEVNQTWGTAGGPVYTPDVSFPGFRAAMIAAFNDRTSLGDGIGIRVEDFVGTVDGRERKYHSTKAATDTIPGKRGMALYVDFTPPVVPPVVPEHASLLGSGVLEAILVGGGVSEAALAGVGTSASPIEGTSLLEHADLVGAGSSESSLIGMGTSESSIAGAADSEHTGLAGEGSSESGLVGAGTSESPVVGSGDSEHAEVAGTGTSSEDLKGGD